LVNDPGKTTPENIEGKELPVARPDFRLRWEMCDRMKEFDPERKQSSMQGDGLLTPSQRIWT
jgi:hypothetical protein